MRDEIVARLATVEPIGLGPSGTTRLAWTAQDRAAGAWFEQQAAQLGLQAVRDPAGNRWAVPEVDPPWWAVGSHLDSVRDGGRFDGALGVAAAFAIATQARSPLAVIAFADEEGARFNTPTFGSKALVGALDVPDALGRVDGDGTTLRAALIAAAVDPHGLVDAPSWLERLRGFVELHIDQSRELAVAKAPVGIVSALAARVRLRIDVRGRADHAGTTRGAERRDALGAAALLIVHGQELAAAIDGMVATATRLLVEPNAPTTIPASTTLWLDARAPDQAGLGTWCDAIDERARAIERDARVTIAIKRASQSEGVVFDDHVRTALRSAGQRLGVVAPEVVCYAGHDAGILADRVPAGMVLVRNQTGVSHAPDEAIDLDDAGIAGQLIVDAIEELATA